MSVRPKFITVEGGEGVGKTTQLKVIQTCLEAAGMSVCMTREPGGTPLGERLRDTLLAPEPSLTPTPMAELLLMFAARAQHVTTIIEPALQRGEWVLCDLEGHVVAVVVRTANGIDLTDPNGPVQFLLVLAICLPVS